ncbi:hypothetical protein E0Z10_g3527 [Xylaria hypoxylon]|uniref:Uncharacterized protein n=1 Tax=Xylaria hypoxylon TaxID=37992 RepID=A0A4Z0Z151_9PEZI|nr:hypothetical protein E0Z10_g3527 [Xylaria hypoxylon]
MVAAASYGKISQSENDHDQDSGISPSESPSSALSSSPMPFLPAVETTFTPLSMDSDFDTNTTTSYGGVDRVVFGNQHYPQKTGASPTDAKEHHPTSFGNAPSLPQLGFSSGSALNLGQQGSYTIGRAPDTRAKANFVPDTGVGFSQNASESHASQQPAGKSPEELSQPQSAQQPVLIRPKPIVRTASTNSVSLRHPTPDLNPRSASRAGNIAQLEATAEKLSMTSSIDDAIRVLHDEQKRVDSRRSSILAASIASIPETEEPIMLPISKQISVASSIRETNTAARYGGYSPAGYVMSPSSSMVTGATRLRSGSTGISKPDADLGGSLSRHGPGKSSVRSVRSITIPTLTNIAEIEPTALTAAAMDEADRLAEEHEEDETLRVPQSEDVDLTPNANLYYESSAHEYWDQPVAEAHQREHNYAHDRPRTSAGSDGTFEQAERAFADFDGAHCSPDADLEDSINFQTLFASPIMESSFIPSFEPDSVLEENEIEASTPLMSPLIAPPTVRPKSYLNPETGENMLYYPARVPMMLNLPQKLSKKPKPQTQNVRKSQVLSAMPNANRQSTASWLPELHSEPPLDPLGPVDSNLTHHSSSRESHKDPSVHAQDENQIPVERHVQINDSNKRASRISMLNPNKRRSQLPDLSNVPPQLRASTYFELPSLEVPAIQLKDGSATSTLDDILNASAHAPVSAFTDHAFAGSLGAEVYGTDKKRRSHMKSSSTTELQEPKNRSSIFHLRKPSALSRHSSSHEEKRGTDSFKNNEERRRSSSSIDGEPALEGEGKGEGEESEMEPTYYGAPTTLLAELQMRKQQQKLRTRPAATAFPNGMHSTLLELDQVAEVERKARKGKRVNLAWEDPNSNQADEDEDEDTPLGLLLAIKGQGSGLIDTITGAPRPLGLMERRDMEDNEPLSVRRNRLQGREAGPIQRMTLGRGLNVIAAPGAPSPQLRVVTPEGDEIEEVEGESLGDRMRRLRSRDDNNPLPHHRPVSSSFSAELLSQLGDAFKEEEPEAKKPGKGKGNSQVQPTEEEETLGQRRLRLQEEREAREREMTRVRLNGGRSSVSPQLTKRHSLADVLGEHNRKSLLSDPRIDAERAKQEEAARYKEDQKRKLAALRHQMPSNLSAPNLVKPGGFMSGRFNDGTGGGLGQTRDNMVLGGFGTDSAIPNPALNASVMGNAFRAGGAMSTYGPPMTTPYANSYGATPQVQSPGQLSNIERWRQGIL